MPLKHLPRTVVGDSIDVLATDARYVGRIRALIPTGDVRSQTFEVRIDLPFDAVARWTVGQLVSVAVPIRVRKLSLTVPRDALVLCNDGTYVFRVNDENIAERIEVELGDSSGELIAVRGPLYQSGICTAASARQRRAGRKRNSY